MQILKLCVFVGLLSGCLTPGISKFEVYDPGESFNRKMYVVGEAIDKRLFVPIAKGYKKVTPDAVENAVNNFFSNIRNIDSAVNGFLQGKPDSGFTDVGRVIVNTTLGIGGLFDVATKVGLQHQREDLGQTLAVWGVKNSTYVYIPVLGPTNVRDVPGSIVNLLLPGVLLGDAYNLGGGSLDVVDRRAKALQSSNIRDNSALDGYAFTREAYFQQRRYLIYDGEPPLDEFDDALFDEVPQ